MKLCFNYISNLNYYLILFSALDRLGFSDYTVEAEAVLKDCKAVAAKRRRQSTRLENLGIPEEELLRQQQELFAKVKYNSKLYFRCEAEIIFVRILFKLFPLTRKYKLI